MLPADLLQYHLDGSRIVPHYLTERDHPWLTEVIEALAALAGEPAAAWTERKAAGWTNTAPEGKRRMALAALERMGGRRMRPCPVHPRELRHAVFHAAAQADPFDRSRILMRVAADFGLDDIGDLLFADMPAQRLLVPPDPLPSAAALAEATNLAMVQGLLRRSLDVRVSMRGNARAIVRQVHLRRLIAVARQADGRTLVEISGVFFLFRRTTMYGRALASIVPLLGWCPDFELVARIRLGSREGELRLGPSDPIGRSRALTPYDSKLEQRFARDVAKQLPDWELVREPEPLEAGGTLIFPDFELRHRAEPKRFLVEVIGFWTPEYLERKVRHLTAAGRSDLVLCIDETRCAAVEASLPDYPVVPFKRRIDPRDVIAAASQLPLSPAPDPAYRVRPGDLHLDFAGRRSPSDPIHDRLEALHAGDSVRLEARGKTLDIVTETGVIARMSRRGCVRLGSTRTRMRGRIVGRTRRHADGDRVAPPPSDRDVSEIRALGTGCPVHG